MNQEHQPFRLALLISGGGGLMRRVASASRNEEDLFRVDRVIASRPDAGGLEAARALGIETEVVDVHLSDPTQSAIWRSIEGPQGVDGVMLLGWLHRLFVPSNWVNRVVNAHPSLLPMFGGQGMWGMNVHRAVIDSGVKVTGCTFHFIDQNYDSGPILAQFAVPVLDTDTPETVATRVTDAQHATIVPFVRSWSSGLIHQVGGRWIGGTSLELFSSVLNKGTNHTPIQ